MNRLWTDTELTQVRAMALQGFTAAQIGEKIDRTEYAIWCKSYQQRITLTRSPGLSPIISDLRILRGGMKISQDAVACYLGVHVGTISKYENGVCDPKLDRLEKWCEFLGAQMAVVPRDARVWVLRKKLDGTHS